MELKNRVALVTGGARGIGRGVVNALAREGVDVAIADLTGVPELAEGAKHAAEDVASHGRRSITIECDVTSEVACNDAVARTIDELGGLDIVVCNAGIAGIGGVADTTLEQWERVFRVNTTGPFLIARAALPHLCAQQRGVIINMASVLGLRATGKRVSYSASKAALVSLTQAMAQELTPYKVRVNCICPSSVRSIMTVGEVQQMTGAATLEEADAHWTELSKTVVPLGRSVEPDDIGRACVSLCLADMVTGIALPVTGGDGL